MKIYTRTGDAGTTSLVGGKRVSKTDIRLDAYGTVDELNSWIGLLATSQFLPEGEYEVLEMTMNRLFDIGSILATEPESKWQPAPFKPACTETLEMAIDRMEETLPRHNRFILPAGCPDAARANIARTVARRAERRILALALETPVDSEVLRFINRLSDYLFVLGRALNKNAGKIELFWEPLA
ncbi:MAG: cob(I)yrinic acid a,c-diamide adenosyltransferase [Muribaculaceae bacterium]|nr:cob(I)yrinic acid a,c-diamide adenosyltransferase [Muribaculaceae bacterium]